MLPLSDPSGRITLEMTTLYSLALLPLGFAAFLEGLTSWISAAGSLLLGGVFFAFAARWRQRRGELHARRLFFASLLYLPLLLGLMVADHAFR